MEWRLARLTTRCVFASFLLLFLGSSAALAGEPVAIGTLLSSTSYYDQQTVTIQGIARQVEVFPPLTAPRGCRLLYGAYIFTLDDDTGAIQVNVNGSCTPGVVFPVGTGGKVVVQGIFHAKSRGANMVISPMPQLEAREIHELPY